MRTSAPSSMISNLQFRPLSSTVIKHGSISSSAFADCSTAVYRRRLSQRRFQTTSSHNKGHSKRPPPLSSTYLPFQSHRSSSSSRAKQVGALMGLFGMFKLAPSNPEDVMVIEQVTPSITTCSVPFSRYGVIKVGGRGTIVRLQTGSIAVFSPVALTEEVKDTINGLGGNVTYLVALDIEHHIFLSQWKAEYPHAEIIGPHGLREKREKRAETRGTEITHIFTPENRAEFDVSEEFDAEFEMEYVYMHPNREIVVYHKPSRTLIEADLMFNLPAMQQYVKSPGGGDQGILTKLFGSAMAATGNTSIWQKRFLWHVASASDRDGFKRSMARIYQWDFDRIIMCHGDVIETGGKDVFRHLFDWFLP